MKFCFHLFLHRFFLCLTISFFLLLFLLHFLGSTLLDSDPLLLCSFGTCDFFLSLADFIFFGLFNPFFFSFFRKFDKFKSFFFLISFFLCLLPCCFVCHPLFMVPFVCNYHYLLVNDPLNCSLLGCFKCGFS